MMPLGFGSSVVQNTHFGFAQDPTVYSLDHILEVHLMPIEVEDGKEVEEMRNAFGKLTNTVCHEITKLVYWRERAQREQFRADKAEARIKELESTVARHERICDVFGIDLRPGAVNYGGEMLIRRRLLAAEEYVSKLYKRATAAEVEAATQRERADTAEVEAKTYRERANAWRAFADGLTPHRPLF